MDLPVQGRNLMISPILTKHRTLHFTIDSTVSNFVLIKAET